MNLFILIGLVASACLIIIYVLVAARTKRRPELNDAVIIILGTGGAVSAVRLMGVVLSGNLVDELPHVSIHTFWSLEPDDAVQVFLGALALGWVSIQTIFESFKKVQQATP
jgi:hypothetical protein